MVDFSKVPLSRNFEDRTGDDLSKINWLEQLGMRAFQNQKLDYKEGTRGLSPEDLRNLLFRKIMEEYGGFYMNQFPPSPKAATEPLIYDKKYR